MQGQCPGPVPPGLSASVSASLVTGPASETPVRRERGGEGGDSTPGTVSTAS